MFFFSNGGWNYKAAWEERCRRNRHIPLGGEECPITKMNTYSDLGEATGSKDAPMLPLQPAHLGLRGYLYRAGCDNNVASMILE